jgi:hypothetical protein
MKVDVERRRSRDKSIPLKRAPPNGKEPRERKTWTPRTVVLRARSNAHWMRLGQRDNLAQLQGQKSTLFQRIHDMFLTVCARADRAPSPAESLVSVASHIPPARAGQANTGATNREGSNTSGTRRGTGRPSNVSTPVTQEAFALPHPRLEQPPSASTSHPSLPPPLAQSHIMANQEWARAPLDGPGVVRDESLPIPNAEDSAVEGDEEEPDTNLYCICRKVSYGQMIGCDNHECPYLWVSHAAVHDHHVLMDSARSSIWSA